MNTIMKQDIERLCAENAALFRRLDDSTVLVTGATGLIGGTLVNALLRSSEGCPGGVKVAAVVRSAEKAERMFGGSHGGRLTLITADVTRPFSVPFPVDYIIHGASQTSSRAFSETPVDTVFTAVDGTRVMLELAKDKAVRSMVFLSTMEIYGAPKTDEKIDETHAAELDTMSARSSYPESKRLCEALCASYNAQYGVPAKALRLTQTFGPGTAYNDGRVFAQFARCAIEGSDIVLRTKGETRRNYLYTADAVSAILTVLLDGSGGEAYNAANESAYCSIYDLAQSFARVCADGRIGVRVEEQDVSAFGYAPVLRMNLDTSKLRSLGWLPGYDLDEMLLRLCASMREDRPVNRNDV